MLTVAHTEHRLPAPAPAHDDFAAAVIGGLSQTRKSLPCRFLYDARGSALFEQITHLADYYPTRAEAAILRTYAGEIAEGVAGGSLLIELGSGSSRKTEILLAALPRLRAYVPIDVSPDALDNAADRLQVRFPALDVRPIVGDFSDPIALVADLVKGPRVGFFPGSTIGNLMPAEAVRLLAGLRWALAQGGRLIIGVDLVKDARTLVRAYNDTAGVTAQFNLNLLARINRELAPVFDLDDFRHDAIFDPVRSRIEMHVVCQRTHSVTVLGRRFQFRAGEVIHTENSYKYTIHAFQSLARLAGWRPSRVWTDPDALFSVHELT